MTTKRNEQKHAHAKREPEKPSRAENARRSKSAKETREAAAADPLEPSNGGATSEPGTNPSSAPPVARGAQARDAIAPTDLEDAPDAHRRVEARAMALSIDDLTSFNIDVVAATSTILGVSSRVVAYRERMARLPEFDIANVDELVDRAKAAWYAAVTNLPVTETKDFQALLDEAAALKTHLLTWAVPLVHAERFNQAAIDEIRDGSGNKDTASDVVALVSLYRSKWDEVRGICGVKEAELARGAVLGPALFAAVARRENKELPSMSDGAQRVRRYWTLADTAYDQCQRAISFLEWGVADVSTIAPSLRRNSGTRSVGSSTTAPKPPAGATQAGEPASAPAAATTAARPPST